METWACESKETGDQWKVSCRTTIEQLRLLLRGLAQNQVPGAVNSSEPTWKRSMKRARLRFQYRNVMCLMRVDIKTLGQKLQDYCEVNLNLLSKEEADVKGNQKMDVYFLLQEYRDAVKVMEDGFNAIKQAREANLKLMEEKFDILKRLLQES